MKYTKGRYRLLCTKSKPSKWDVSNSLKLPYVNNTFVILPVFIFFSLIFSLLWTNRLCTANGVVLDSMGVVSSGRGGTNISHADNGVLIHDNPSALVNMPAGKLLDMSSEFIYPEIRYEDPYDFDYSKHEVFIIPAFSFVYKKTEESRFAFGGGVFVPACFSTEYRLKHSMTRSTPEGDVPVSFGNQLYRSEASLIKMLAATSFKVTEKLSLGVSLGSAYQAAELELPYTFQEGPLAGVSVLGDLDAQDYFGFTYTLGSQYKITENTVVGFSFVSESQATLRGEADVTIPDEAPESALFSNKQAEYDMESNFEWPRSIGMGVSHKINASNTFSFDLVYLDWASAFDSLSLELTDGDNEEFNAALGNKISDSFPIDWDSTFALRFGYEYFFKGNTNDIVRCGYIYNENPVPQDTQVPFIPGTLKHTFSVGYTHKWNRWEFDTASQFMMSDRDSVNSSDIVGGDYDESSMKTKAYLLFLGVKYHF